MEKKKLIIIGAVAGGTALVAITLLVIILRMRATEGLEPVMVETPSGPAVQIPASGTPMNAEREKLIEQEKERLAALPKDSDGDGLSDDEEKKLGSNINEGDTDGDGYNDAEEVQLLKTDPTKFDEGALEKRIAQLEERLASVSSTKPTTQNTQPAPAPSPAPVDIDGDGLTAEQEAGLGTDPNNPDTDADGVSDRQEAETYKTDPLKADTDGDSYTDGSEIQSGYNPLGPGRCSRETCIP